MNNPRRPRTRVNMFWPSSRWGWSFLLIATIQAGIVLAFERSTTTTHYSSSTDFS